MSARLSCGHTSQATESRTRDDFSAGVPHPRGLRPRFVLSLCRTAFVTTLEDAKAKAAAGARPVIVAEFRAAESGPGLVRPHDIR
jgi:hypothetical protein